MADPLGILRTSLEPVTPDPNFSSALRVRLQRALDLPRGVVVTDLADLDLAMDVTPSSAAPEPFPRPGALPYLTVRGARAALEFYIEAFGARQLEEPVIMPDGKIGHCELSVGGGVVYLAEEFPDLGLTGPIPGQASVSLMLPVTDTDAVLERARAAGATVEAEPADHYGRRGATLIDPFGHRWMLSAPLPGAATERIRHGDIGYVSWWTPDADRAARFYRAVLGWELGSHGQVDTLTRQVGIDGGHELSTLFCCYAVENLTAALASVREHGGSASAPREQRFGSTSDCTDPAGTAFAVYQPQPGDHRPPVNGVKTGDITYVTFRPRGSSAPVRAFYGAVLGWEFSPGHVEDGWEPVGVHPMAGMAGGGDGATVPMWQVPDVATATEAVVAAGGTVVSAPARQPYGMSAECLDDQGGRFYLGDA